MQPQLAIAHGWVIFSYQSVFFLSSWPLIIGHFSWCKAQKIGGKNGYDEGHVFSMNLNIALGFPSDMIVHETG